jgi:predicted carbohydrate-binding protein with CBM5 and CBM33 domain
MTGCWCWKKSACTKGVDVSGAIEGCCQTNAEIMPAPQSVTVCAAIFGIRRPTGDLPGRQVEQTLNHTPNHWEKTEMQRGQIGILPRPTSLATDESYLNLYHFHQIRHSTGFQYLRPSEALRFR